MLPSELKAAQFKAYPLEARELASGHLPLLQQLPASFVPLLLKEIIVYDWKFPAERADLERQLAYLASLPPPARQKLLAGFAQVKPPAELERFDWVNKPAQYSERLTAYLWATRQIDAFRSAATGYVSQVEAAMPRERLPFARLGIAVIGAGVVENKYRLFRKLRPHGVYFTAVEPENGLRILFDAVGARAAAHPLPHGHWYIEGGAAEAWPQAGVNHVSYEALEPVRTALLKKMKDAIQSGIGGPEALRTLIAQLRPEEVGLRGAPQDAVLDRFQVSVLTEGSGTQIFSTTFVQWAAREAWRRAQPLTLLARFRPRQRERPMSEMITHPAAQAGPDPQGSLIDADMGAYYTWLNQQRLPGAEQSAFLVWFEDHSEALAIAPTLPAGTESASSMDLKQLLSQIA